MIDLLKERDYTFDYHILSSSELKTIDLKNKNLEENINRLKKLLNIISNDEIKVLNKELDNTKKLLELSEYYGTFMINNQEEEIKQLNELICELEDEGEKSNGNLND